MLSKEINLTYDMCYTAWVEILRNPLSSAKEMDILESLIKKHFELVEKYEMLSNTYSMLCEDYLNPQPYKFEDLKVGMWVYLKDNNELVLIDFTTYNPETGERFVYFWVVRHIGVVRFEFKENRFYPVYIVK